MHKQLEKADLELVVRRLPKDVRTLMLANRGDLFVGGGFIRAVIANEDVSDIDFFGRSHAFLSGCATTVEGQRDKDHTRVLRTKNAITLATENRLPLQFITRWRYETPEAIVDEFDFTICQAVVYVRADGLFTSLVGPTFYSDLAAKRLVYTSPARDEEAGGSLMRVIKYVKRGYRIQAGSLGAVTARVVEKWEPGGRVSMADYAVARMQEVDPLMIIDGMPVDDHETVNGLPDGESA
ncbi:hypothetical protein PhaeoP66_03248 [Phaeobacter inhibens]|uniref:Uncharacterized protein n=1 Tax=Phaeobacter inhibens TaxID=221822 RepID=A0ABM6RHN5_9RHOB|nr:hypothetical protein [Phaeobacter inhibens]AUQ95990.1 hypothetical protein PhaeoP66_03248 [Phaeobacter inhibens]